MKTRGSWTVIAGFVAGLIGASGCAHAPVAPTSERTPVATTTTRSNAGSATAELETDDRYECDGQTCHCETAKACLLMGADHVCSPHVRIADGVCVDKNAPVTAPSEPTR